MALLALSILVHECLCAWNPCMAKEKVAAVSHS